MATIIVAAAQTAVELGNRDANLAGILRVTKEAATRAARLVVFPECALSGYCFEDAREATSQAETVPGPATETLHRVCRETGCVTIVGLVERAGGLLYNTAVVVGPEGLIGRYRKCHLPLLGLDRFVTPGGGPLVPFDTPAGRIGVGICYDGSFPETARALKLRGAQLFALPTNWPEGGPNVSAQHHTIVRAHENHMFMMAVNRIGVERSFTFIGQSKIVDCDGRVLAAAGSELPELLLAQVDLHKADANRVINRPGQYELDCLADRRPDLYGALTE